MLLHLCVNLLHKFLQGSHFLFKKRSVAVRTDQEILIDIERIPVLFSKAVDIQQVIGSK